MAGSKVYPRIDANLRLCPDFQGDDRLAARHLFSHLSHLEQIAVIAAERGDGIEGQLEDELVHRNTFATLADRFGGCVPPCPEAQRLIDYLESLGGDLSLATLNVVAESWLETVFDHLNGWGFAGELFETIEAEEARHVHDALELARPDPGDAEPVLRDLEAMLGDIAVSAAFMLPMIHFGGLGGCGRMGLDIVRAHRRGCAHLGVTPGLRRLEKMCRTQTRHARRAPEPIEMNAWEVSKTRLWAGPAPQLLFEELPVDTVNPAKIQARVVHALGRIQARHPELRQVIRRGQLYRTQEPVVGVRAVHSHGQVITPVLSNPNRGQWKQVVSRLARKMRRIRDEPYEPVPDLAGLEALLPPSACPMVVSSNAEYGGIAGTGPLSDVEGIPTCVTIGRPLSERPPTHVTVTIQMDHRVGDGREIGVLASELRREMA